MGSLFRMSAGVLYFLIYGTFACLLPFVNLFLEKKGLTLEQLGLIGSLCALLTFFACTLWSLLADSTKQHR